MLIGIFSDLDHVNFIKIPQSGRRVAPGIFTMFLIAYTDITMGDFP